MITIDLKDYYPELYKESSYIEVQEEVAEYLIERKRRDLADRRRMYRYRAEYSIDSEEWVTAHAVEHYFTTEEWYENRVLLDEIFRAILQLSNIESVRTYKRFFLGLSGREIAQNEGVTAGSVQCSLQSAREKIKIYFKYF